jgi:hypothetical protein
MYDHKITYKSTGEFLQFLSQKEKQSKKANAYKTKENKNRPYKPSQINNA